MSDHEAKTFLQLALARSAEGDHTGEEQALNRWLEIQPRSLTALILKADCRLRAGDSAGASYYYRAAIDLGAAEDLQEVNAAYLRRAEQTLAELATRADAERIAKLSERGVPPESWSPRFRHSIDLAAGRKKLYLQQPGAFNFPELPHVQFYDPNTFEWAPVVEAATSNIRAELVELLKDGTNDFRAYIQAQSDLARMEGNKALLGNMDWSALFLCENGWVVPKIVERCPKTWESVLQAPIPRISGWGPTIMFSLLKAGASIAPHHGMFNTRLICHLPLIVPAGCRFRVGNEVREWQEGKLLIFDDTIEHEAWNDSSDDRVVLIFDIWRPELSEQERYELTALFSD